MNLASCLITIPAAALLLASAIAFLKARDVFIMAHIAKISNVYFVSLLLLGVEIKKFSYSSLVKIIILIALNLVIVNLIVYATTKRAIINKILPDAENR